LHADLMGAMLPRSMIAAVVLLAKTGRERVEGAIA
jgi:hypothetical protein